MKSKERKQKHKDPLFRRRGFLAALLMLLAGATVFSGGCAFFLYGQWRHTEQELHSLNDNASHAFEQMANVFKVTLHAHRRDDRPITIEEISTLARMADGYEKFLKQNADQQNLRAVCARKSTLLGEYYSQTGAVAKAEEAYRQAQRIYAALLEEMPLPEFRLAQAENNNYLSHLLAQRGRLEPARQATKEAVQLLTALTDEFPNQPQFRLELAVAYNNAALLALEAGTVSQAQQDLLQQLVLLRQLAAELPEQAGGVERLLDAQQVLTGCLWQSQRLDEAKKIYRSHLDLMEQLREKRDTMGAVTLDLMMAHEAALANYELLENAVADDDSPKRKAGWDWKWRPLFPRDGKTIQPDILVRGTMPGEFEQHDALLLTFRWRDGEQCLKAVTEIAAAVWANIRLVIIVPDSVAQKLLCEHLDKAGVPMDQVHFYRIPTDSIWVRDYGPLSIRTNDNGIRWVNAMYAATRFHDDHVPASLGRLLGICNTETSLCLWGGNLLSDGQGLCIATEELLDRNAERGHDKEHVTKTVQRLFGASQVVYLEKLKGEPTGDVDWFAAFTSANTIVVGDYTGIDPENAAILDRNAERLSKVMIASGPLRVVRIPMPPRGDNDDFFGGTYTNVVFANGVLLVPTWPGASRQTEKQALDTYRKLLPNWTIVGINAEHLRFRFGAFRCMTMQLHQMPDSNPAAVMSQETPRRK